MAASVSSGDDGDGTMSDINVTPLVDVVLVLLIVFMITIPAVVGSDPLDVNLPTTGAVKPADVIPPMSITIQRAGENSLTFFVNDEQTTKEGLLAVVQDKGLPPEDQAVALRADAALEYSEVIEIMNMLHSIGMRKIAIDTHHVE